MSDILPISISNLHDQQQHFMQANAQPQSRNQPNTAPIAKKPKSRKRRRDIETIEKSDDDDSGVKPLFHKMVFLGLCSYKPYLDNDGKRLIEANGGTVVRMYKSKGSTITHIIGSTRDLCDGAAFKAVQNGIPIHTYQWLQDCVAQGKLLDGPEYLLNDAAVTEQANYDPDREYRIRHGVESP